MFIAPVDFDRLPEGTHSLVSEDHFARNAVTDLSKEERSRITKLLTTIELPEGTASSIRAAYSCKG